MPNFSYKALDSAKQIVSGSSPGRNRQEVAQFLTKKGLTPLTVREIPERVTVKGTVPAIDKITFCRYLGTMLSSGLSLSEGIDVLRDETKHPLMRRILGDMSYSLEQGQQLSSVFERYPHVFEPYFLTLTKAGEVSGKLAEVKQNLELSTH
jgi:type II secretory pathway component PulF